LYTTLEYQIIDPIAGVLLFKIKWTRSETELPYWFEHVAAPILAVFVILLALYGCGFFVHTRVRQGIDWVLLRVPLVSVIYDALRSMVLTLEKPREKQRPQRMVLVEFPHTGTKVPAFVTATCRDTTTGKTIVCVYIPTTPMPTSGYFLLVPEELVTELNWSIEQTLQAIMSGGLTTPPEVHYFKDGPAAHPNPPASHALGDFALAPPHDRQG
jgi:uncharacterized membrane protein